MSKATAQLDFYGEVGDAGIQAATFLRDLRGLGDVRELTVNIGSDGGQVFDGLTIYSALRRHPAKVTCRVDGRAASIASVIAMAGDTVEMPENAFLMLHEPSADMVGTATDLRTMADLLDRAKASMAAAYRDKPGLSEAKVAELMAAVTWLSAAEANELGFCDVVTSPVRMAAHASAGLLARYPHVPPALARACEVQELCALAGVPHRAAAFLASGAGPVAVRKALLQEVGAMLETALPDASAIYASRRKAVEDARKAELEGAAPAAASPIAAAPRAIEDIDANRIYASRARAMGRT